MRFCGCDGVLDLLPHPAFRGKTGKNAALMFSSIYKLEKYTSNVVVDLPQAL